MEGFGLSGGGGGAVDADLPSGEEQAAK
jgi:hypothetical protein